MVGRVTGLALLHGQQLPVQFALPLIKQLLGMELGKNDLLQLDPELHKHILDLRSFTAEQLADLELDFTVDEHHFGKRRKVSLTMDGEKILVTKGNVDVYISLYIEHYLRRNADMLSSLQRGLHQFCPKKLLLAAAVCFTESEFDILLSGSQDIDINDWQKQTKYMGCSGRTPVVKWFWAALRSFSKQQQGQVLRFATGHSNVPIGGFRMLKSEGEVIPFAISLKAAPNPKDPKSHFPTAATCINKLMLPRYDKPDSLKKFLLLAVQEDMMAFEEHS
eukprot:gnl/TRDRNA2_/TRDRNA2_172233_c4_seq2.p1 gnl/TRDRNA2_/TRDRNA2_172233_c4~~gnl/TRDRNA2_/TRDRNA2_172233_c4_seq2.p1  ORF type:complete len:277 (+),score=64.51 gnl/TRDRNA2_/TRDRNA2_172233_c4_seq2:2-832(+)